MYEMFAGLNFKKNLEKSKLNVKRGALFRDVRLEQNKRKGC